MSKIKFIRTYKNEFLIFPEMFGHVDIAALLTCGRERLRSAGFVAPNMDDDSKKAPWVFNSYGKSIGLQLESIPFDDNDYFDEMTQYTFVQFDTWNDLYCIVSGDIEGLFNQAPIKTIPVTPLLDGAKNIWLVDSEQKSLKPLNYMLYSSHLNAPDFVYPNNYPKDAAISRSGGIGVEMK